VNAINDSLKKKKKMLQSVVSPSLLHNITGLPKAASIMQVIGKAATYDIFIFFIFKESLMNRIEPI